jgi:hypothetical protein
MNVYPTRRSAAFPQPVYAETAANASAATLAPGGDGVTGTKGGIPFRAPKDGLEAIWNTILRYRGDTYATRWRQTVGHARRGVLRRSTSTYEFDFNYGNLATRRREYRDDNRLGYVLQTITGTGKAGGSDVAGGRSRSTARGAEAERVGLRPGAAAVRPAPRRTSTTTIRARPRTACVTKRRLPAVQRRDGSLRVEAHWAGRSSTFLLQLRNTGFPGKRADGLPTLLLGGPMVNPDYAR